MIQDPKKLRVSIRMRDEAHPIQITRDGTMTLNSVQLGIVTSIEFHPMEADSRPATLKLAQEGKVAA
jgi:hypothetical protein